MQQNPDKIGWHYLSQNQHWIYPMEQNQDKIDWFCLSANPSIFEYDYQAMKDRTYELGFCEDCIDD